MADKKPANRDEELMFDKRTLERRVSRGQVQKGDVESRLKNLPDLADKADNIASLVWPEQPAADKHRALGLA